MEHFLKKTAVTVVTYLVADLVYGEVKPGATSLARKVGLKIR